MTPVKFAMRALALILVPPATWWAMDQSPAIEVDAFRIVTPQVARGGSLEVAYHTTFFRRCSGDGNRFFVDAAGVSIPAERYSFRDGIGRNGQPVPLDNPQWMTIKATIPAQATPGAATYQNVSDFFCNPLQRYLQHGIKFAYPLIRFRVTDAPIMAAQPPLTAFLPLQKDVDLRERARLVPQSSTSRSSEIEAR